MNKLLALGFFYTKFLSLLNSIPLVSVTHFEGDKSTKGEFNKIHSTFKNLNALGLMSKDLPYFRFTCQEWQNGSITLLPLKLQGLFINICSYYWLNNCHISIKNIKKRLGKDAKLIQKLIQNEIIFEKNGFIIVKFLDHQWAELSEFREKKKIAGSLGGKQKASNAKNKSKQNPSYKEKEKDKEKDKENLSNSEFVKPSILELENHIKQNGFGFQALVFWNHYEGSGWKLASGNKMDDWKAICVEWELRNKPPIPPADSKRVALDEKERIRRAEAKKRHDEFVPPTAKEAAEYQKQMNKAIGVKK